MKFTIKSKIFCNVTTETYCNITIDRRGGFLVAELTEKFGESSKLASARRVAADK